MIKLIVTAIVAYLLQSMLPGVAFQSIVSSLLFCVVLALINTFIKPILDIIGMPLSIISLGLFQLVINGAVILLADHFVPGVEINGLGNAIIFSIVLSVIGWFF